MSEVTPARYRAGLRSGSGPHGVEATVDVDDLAAGRGEEVREQRDDRLGGRRVVRLVPAQRGAVLPHRLEVLEARDRLGGQGLERAGRHQVGADALLAE